MALPTLDRLVLCATGTRERALEATLEATLGRDDIVQAVLLQLANGNYDDVCKSVSAWCATNTVSRRVCAETNPMWTELRNKVFPNSTRRMFGDRENFYAQCKRAKAYRDGDIDSIEFHPLDQAVRQFALAAVRHDGRALKHVRERFENDREIVEAAVDSDGVAVRWASDTLRFDRSISERAVTTCGEAWGYLELKFMADRHVTLIAAKTYGNLLGNVLATVWRTDREIVLMAVNQNGEAVRYAAGRARSDREILLAAVRQNANALYYIDEDIVSGDREIVMEAVSKDGATLSYVSKDSKLRKDIEIIFAALKSAPGPVLEYMSIEDHQRILAETKVGDDPPLRAMVLTSLKEAEDEAEFAFRTEYSSWD